MKRIIFTGLLLLTGMTLHSQETLHSQGRTILTSDSVSLYVNVKGSGTPCLYLHGGPGSGSFWMEKFFGDYLEKHFQMIYLDQRGVGRSTSPLDGDFSMERMVCDFEEIRQALEIDQWLTLGHSFGGILQMGYWEKHPQAIAGMIMINCTVSMEDSFGKSWLQKAAEFTGTEYRPVQTFTPDTLMSRLMEVSRALDEQGVRWKMTFVSPEDEKLINDTYNGFPSWNSDFGNQAMFIQDYWNDYRDLTKEVKVPVLFYYGKNDWPVGPEHYKGIGFPNMILRGSDVIHFPFLENPEDLEEAIDTFTHQFSF